MIIAVCGLPRVMRVIVGVVVGVRVGGWVGGRCVSHRLALVPWLKTHLQQEIRLLLDCCGFVYIDMESRRQG